MPELETCVRYRDKIYCWDDVAGKIVEVVVKDLTHGECPECVVAAIVRKRSSGSSVQGV